MKCQNEKCQNEAALQFDHNGKLTYYCVKDFERWCRIMSAIGDFAPTAYPIGTKTYG